MQKLIDGVWVDCTEEDLIVGDVYRITVGNGGWQQQTYTAGLDKSTIERQWRDSELLRTDEFVKLPDYPIDLLPYRMELRNYPTKFDFPNGDRPTV